MNPKRIATGQPGLSGDQALRFGRNRLNQESDLMFEGKMNQNELVSSELEVSGEFETVEETPLTAQVSKENVMFDLELEPVLEVEYADCTVYSEQELKNFLATLSEAQLSDTQVLADDDSFVVFYPLLEVSVELPGPAPRSGYHFDTDGPRPTVFSAEVPELVGRLAEQFPLPPAPEKAQVIREILTSVLI
jgi:hypothetical protein